MVDSNLVDLFVGFNSGLKRDYGSKTKERKNSDIKDCSFDVTSALAVLQCSTIKAFAFRQIDLLI
jgi:hypothetical protein